MLGLGAVGQFAIGQVGSGTAEVITVDKWFQPLSEPPRFRKFNTALQQFATGSPLPFVPFAWFVPLSEPAVKVKVGLTAGQQQALAFDPVPFVSFGWFAQLSEPVRFKRNIVREQQPFTTDTSVIPVSMLMPWFAPLSEPPRFKPGLTASLQQSIAWPPRLLPTPTVTGTMSANETPDDFLGSGREWNRVSTGEVGLFTQAFPSGESGIAQPIIATANVSISIK